MVAAGTTGRRPGTGAVLLRTGGLAGLLSGLVGVGGGVIMVPAMVSPRVGMAQKAATGTSLAAILPIAVVGALTYGGQRSVDGFAAACVIPGSIAGAVVGARLTRHIPDRALALVFAALALAAAIRLIVPSGLSDGSAISVSPVHAVALLGVGLVAGLAAGLLGIGGGVIVVPILVLGFGVSQQLAQGTSLATIIPTGLSGAITHSRLGNVDSWAARVLGSAGAVGALAGALLATHLPQQPLRLLFAAYVAFTGLRVARDALRPPPPADPADRPAARRA